MFCRKCGAAVDEGETICPGCGAPVGVPSAPVPAPVAPAPAAPVVKSPLQAACSSPMFLAAAICLSVTAVFQLIAMFTSTGTVGQISVYLDLVDDARLGEASGTLMGMGILYLLIALGLLAVTAVTLTGLWMTYVSSRAADREPGLIRGLRLVRGGALAEMVCTIVGLSFLAVVFLVVAIMGGCISSGALYLDSDEMVAGALLTAVGVVGLILMIGTGAVLTVFYLEARAALGNALATVKDQTAAQAPSLFLIVVCFVLGGLSLVNMLLTGFAGGFRIVGTMAGITADILFGLVAVRYRRSVLAH